MLHPETCWLQNSGSWSPLILKLSWFRNLNHRFQLPRNVSFGLPKSIKLMNCTCLKATVIRFCQYCTIENYMLINVKQIKWKRLKRVQNLLVCPLCKQIEMSNFSGQFHSVRLVCKWNRCGSVTIFFPQTVFSSSALWLSSLKHSWKFHPDSCPKRNYFWRKSHAYILSVKENKSKILVNCD